MLKTGMFVSFLALLSVGVMAEETRKLLTEWNYKPDLSSGATFYNSDENHPLTSEVIVDSGKNVLCVNVNGPVAKAPHHKQINFTYDKDLTTGSTYLIEFDVKGSARGKISVSALICKKPWSPLGKGASRGFVVDTEWKTIKLSFTASQDWSGKKRLPMIGVGQYPADAKLYFGPIKVYQVQKFLPYALNKEWKLFPAVDAAKIDLAKIDSIPESLPGKKTENVNATPVIIEEKACDVKDVTGYAYPKDAAVFFNEFESPEAGMTQLGASADWWFEFYVNGKKVYSTVESGGNCSQEFTPEDHVFNVPTRKGRNLVAVKVLSGSKGWKFACGDVPFRENVGSFYAVKDGDGWKAINMKGEWNPKGIYPIKIAKMMVKPGTALDLSRFNDAPAGKYGAVMINKDGKLAFEKNPDKPVKFRSFNLVFFWRTYFYNMSKPEIDELARAIALRGYNMVRLHFLEAGLMGHGGLPKSVKVHFLDAKIPQSEEELPLDKGFLDRVDYFIAKLKENGIYLDVAITHSCGWTEATAMAPKKTKNPGEGYRSVIYFRDDVKRNWTVGAKFLLTHINPYTKSSILDDNLIVNVTFQNEQDIRDTFYPAFTPHWRQFVKDKYQTAEKLAAAWGDEYKSFSDVPPITNPLLQTGSPAGIDATRFLEKIMCDITGFYYHELRKIGYKGPFSNWDMYMRLIEVPPRSMVSLVSMHSYHDHVSKKKLSAKYKQKNLAFPWWKNTEKRFSQESSIKRKAVSYFRRVAATRFLDRPFMINEYAHGSYNQYHHEQGLVFGAYAALQDWDSLGTHANVVMVYHCPSNLFSSATDPVSRASELIAAFAWERGDVKSAKGSVDYAITPEMVYSKNAISAIGGEYNKIALLTKIGNSYPQKPLEPVANVKPDLSIQPKEFAWTAGSEYFAITKDILDDGSITRGIVKTLRDKNILPSGNRTDIEKGIYQSETGEITTDVKDGTMSVITPRLEGAIVKEDQRVKLDKLTIEKCSTPACVTAIALDENQTLSNASRALLVFSTHAVGANTVFATRKMNRVIEAGTFPMLMKTGELAVTIKTSQTQTPKVYALDMDGTRQEEIPAKIKDAALSISLNTAKLQYSTPYFEIVWQ